MLKKKQTGAGSTTAAADVVTLTIPRRWVEKQGPALDRIINLVELTYFASLSLREDLLDTEQAAYAIHSIRHALTEARQQVWSNNLSDLRHDLLAAVREGGAQ